MTELAFLGRPHTMIDIETLSRLPTAAVVSIGAVNFSFKRGLLEEFKVNISAKSCKDHGLHIEKETLDWWASQSKEARMAWMANPVSLEEGLTQLEDFLGKNKDRMVWCNGASFDFPAIRNACIAVGKELPWSYRNEMCQRTINTVLGVSNNVVRQGENQGLHHDALEDAKEQARYLITLFDDK